MIKNYTVKEKTHKIISSSKASVRYVLVDEQGEERVVEAVAKLGLAKRIKSIRPIYHRETPLVDALSKASLNDLISVDFSEFNQNNPRTAQYLDESHIVKPLRSLGSLQAKSTKDYLSVDPVRILQLFLMASVGIVAFLAI